MGQPGQYPFRLLLLRCTRTADTSTNDRPRTYAPAGYLWGSVDLDNASVGELFGAPRDTISGTIRLRNWPNVTTLDRLYWPRFGMTLEVNGVRPDFANNETVCDVTVFSRGDYYQDATGGLGAT